ncbi:hypothetical protein ABIE21_003366 [Conyzicola nivalis]|uniref:DUF4383 domain-containing protein n=1 Tax=Conyzicola nivalis TaxID=1477021 RepID=A0ABV2QS30_9MICO
MSQSPNRLVAVIVGGFYVALGLVGFTATAGVDVVSTTGGFLFGVFGVNVLQNILHVVIGAALLAAGFSGVRLARATNAAVGALFLALGLAGLFVVGTDSNILALNGADNVLHFGSSIVLLAVALGADKPAAVTAPTGTKPAGSPRG